MRIATIIAAVVCAGTMALAGVAHAQIGVAANNEIDTATAAQKLLQPLDAANDPNLIQSLEKNGIDTSPGEITYVEPTPIPTDPFWAEGGPLKIFNCTGGSIKVKTYNSNDPVVLVAYQEKSIGNGSAGGLKCATKSCKVQIGSGNVYSALSGPQVLLSGKKLQGTNAATISRGCGAYR